jgi:hypothetical protein
MDVIGKFKIQPDAIKYSISKPLFYNQLNQPVSSSSINKDEIYLTHIKLATKYFQYLKLIKIYTTKFIVHKKCVSLDKIPYFSDSLTIETNGQSPLILRNDTNHKRMINHLIIIPYNNDELSLIFKFTTMTLIIERLTINNIKKINVSPINIKFIRQIETNQPEIIQYLIESHVACSIIFKQECNTQEQTKQIERLIQSLNFHEYRHHLFNSFDSVELHIVKDNDPFSIY